MSNTANNEVLVVVGPGQIGQAIARRVGFGKHVLLADRRQENANAAAEVLGNAGYDVSVKAVDVSSRDDVHALVETATGLGQVTGLVHAAGVSPSQASVATILKVDLYGTALVLEEFGNVIERGGSGVVIASQSGHRLPPLPVEQNKALATTPVEELLSLPFLQPDRVTDTLHAYQISKRGNSLRVMAEAVRWGKRGARINTISPGTASGICSGCQLQTARAQSAGNEICVSEALGVVEHGDDCRRDAKYADILRGRHRHWQGALLRIL